MLAMLLLTAAVLSVACYAGPKLHAFFGSDNFLMICVATHVTNICLLAIYAATARTPAERRYYAECTAASTLHLACNLYLVLVAVSLSCCVRWASSVDWAVSL